MNKIITDFYNDPKNGYPNAEQIYRNLHKKHPYITKAEITRILSKKADVQIMKEVRKPRKFNTITATRPLECTQMDIINYDRYTTKEGYKYILCIIDVYSRYAVCRPIKTKEMRTVLKLIIEMFQELKGIPNNINCDNEFSQAKLFTNWANTNNIKMWYSYSDDIIKNSIVERFNKTLSLKLQKWRVNTGGSDWVKILPDIVQGYNNSHHRTIKAKPHDVFFMNDINNQQIQRVVSKLKIGDIVRIKRNKNTFEKGDEIKLSIDIYSIIDIIKNRFKLKKLKNETIMKKLYREHEIKKISVTDKENLEKITNNYEKMKKRKMMKKINVSLRKNAIDKNNISTTKKRKTKTLEGIEYNDKDYDVKVLIDE